MLMKLFLKLTHFEMIKPTPYGSFHLSFLILSIVALFVFCRFFKSKNERRSNQILFFVGLFLLVLEIYKQIYFTLVIGNGYYIWAVFPLQPCSIPMYLCLLVPFIKGQNIKKGFYNYIYIYGTLGGVVVLLFPNNVFTTHLTMNLHTVVWHFALVFLGVFLYKIDLIDINNGYKIPAILYLCFALTAFFINIFVNKFLNQFISLFFIGPNIENIFLITDLHRLFGWQIASVLTIFLVSIIGYAFFRITKLLKNKNSVYFSNNVF